MENLQMKTGPKIARNIPVHARTHVPNKGISVKHNKHNVFFVELFYFDIHISHTDTH